MPPHLPHTRTINSVTGLYKILQLPFKMQMKGGNKKFETVDERREKGANGW